MELHKEFKLWESMWSLQEAKADIQKLVDFAGEDLANRFLVIKDKLKAPQNDLYYWIKNHTVEELEQAIIAAENTKSNRQQARDISDRGANLIGENGIYRVYHITSYEAAKKYGAGTKWCITGINNYGRKYWDEYTEEHGVEFYFFLPKSNAEITSNLKQSSITDPFAYDPVGRVWLRDDSVDPKARIKPSMLQYVKHALAVYPSGAYEIFNAEDKPVSSIPSAPYNNDLNASNLPEYDVGFAYCPNCGNMWYDIDNTTCSNCHMEVGFCYECDYYCACKPGEELLCSECSEQQ